MDKKAQVIDVFSILLVIMVLGFVMYLGYYVLSQIAPALESQGVNISIINRGAKAYIMLDYAMPFVLAIFGIGLIITGVLIEAHPIFIAINIISAIFLMFIIPGMLQMWIGVTGSAELSTVADNFPITNAIVGELGKIFAVFEFIALGALYAKTR